MVFRIMRIGLIGGQRVGKDTVAEYIVNHFPKFKKLAFSDPLYKQCSKFFNMKEKERRLLIGVGALTRSLQKDFYVNALKNKLSDSTNIIVTDCRFPNEFQMLKDQGFFIVRVNALTEDVIKRGGDIEYLNAPSEIMHRMFKSDYVLWNTSTKEDLYYQIEQMIQYISVYQEMII